MKQEGKKKVTYIAGAIVIGLVAGGALREPNLEARTNVLERQALRLGQRFGSAEEKPPSENPPSLDTRVADLERAVRSLDRDLRWAKSDIRHLGARVSIVESRIRSKSEE